ncbi:hypothetical protein CRI94_15630 [Longibacter salinarum]|uniref:Uncharacterized protein n=2 Tax=Longibacter salinarum TaxID=1850348 RepID=A0A2A8CU80_9BACT|nr:hypothetical protein CRI94_15630 [Longibacter salinarum]
MDRDTFAFASVRRVLALAMCAVPLLLFVGCDSSGSNDDVSVEPSYSLSVTGNSVNTTFTGAARWGNGSTDASNEAMAVNFSSDDGTGQGFLIRGAARPETGTVSVRNIDGQNDNLTSSSDFSFYYVNGQSDTSIQYLSTGGTITITESTENRLAGSFDITVTRIDPLAPNGGESSATITGTFDAPYDESGVGAFTPQAKRGPGGG